MKPTSDEMQFRLVVKTKNETLLDVVGIPRRQVNITAKDMAQAFEAEQIIERLLGIRVHILQMPPEV